jgi:hypothetical protein
MRPSSPATLAICLGIVCARTARADEAPRLRWDLLVRCMYTPGGEAVRVQCDDAHRECLVAPDKTAAGSGLTRVQECPSIAEAREYEELVRAGARMVPAVAEAPPGFERDRNGRAFQTKFDLLDRVYVGAAWAPSYERGSAVTPAPPGLPFGRGEAELGMDASVLSPQGRSRHDFQVLQGTVAFTDLQVSGLLFAYDYQQVHRRPAFWVTSFLGPPRVFPVSTPLGWGFRLLDVEDHPPAARSSLDMELAEVHLSWNPLQSDDMYRRLRFEAGADLGKSWADRATIAGGFDAGRWYVGFTSAVRSRVSLGEGGLHYLFADVTYVRPTLVVDGDLPQRAVNRLEAKLAYEGVLIALNDQPVSLRVAATGAARDDLAGGARNVEVGATAGLRFSFWAPPRALTPLPDLEDP